MPMQGKNFLPCNIILFGSANYKLDIQYTSEVKQVKLATWKNVR